MKFVSVFLILLSFSLGESLTQKLQKLIDNRSEKSVEILKYNPFVTKKETKKPLAGKIERTQRRKKVKKRDMSLIAILDNRAFVGGRWITKNDTIGGYRVEKVLRNSVILVNKKGKMILRFKKSKKILSVRER